jgi:hypothetical protein
MKKKVFASRDFTTTRTFDSRKTQQLKASSQDLNKQQTLKPDDDFIRNFIRYNNSAQMVRRAKSASNLATAKRALNTSHKLNGQHANSIRQDLAKIRNSTSALRMSSYLPLNNSKYMELPLSKTVIHNKPVWVFFLKKFLKKKI